jgi:type IV pilus assembly protein PilM
LAAPDDIRSTEKLLNLIRNPSPIRTQEPATAADRRETATAPAAWTRSVRFKRKFTVGVDIGHTYLRMAKTGGLPDNEYELLDYLDIPFNKQVSLKDPEVLERLKAGLEQICGDGAACDIWSAIPAGKVETRYLQIPKLPAKQVANAVFWSFTKKVEFNAQEESLDYEILGDIDQGGTKKTEVLAFKTPKAETAELKAAFEQIGYPLTGITIVPFAVQNLFRANIVAPEEKEVCCLFVGRDWSRIAIYGNGHLVLSRGIKAGMRSMVEAIDIALRKNDGTWPENGEAVHEIAAQGDAQRTVAVQPEAQQKFFEMIATPLNRTTGPSPEKRQEHHRVFEMILPALERLIRQVERTFEHFAANFPSEGARRLYLSGRVTANAAIVNHFSKQLDMPVEVMNPFTPGTAFVRPVNIPETQDERESYVPAIGLAISRKGMTPNCLFTHQQRDQEEEVRRVNMRVLTGCIICLMAFIGLFSWQERRLDTKRNQIEQLHQKLAAFNPPAEKEVLLALYSQNQNKQHAFRKIVQRYAPLAVLNELAQITPAHVRLVQVNANFSGQNTKSTSEPRQVTVEGIIFGTPESLEGALTSYLLGLRNSQLFNKPSILKKSQAFYNGQEVLRFRARLELI